MARRYSPQSPKGSAVLSPSQIQTGIQKLKRRVTEVEAFNPLSVTDQYDTPDLNAIEASIDEALVQTFGADTLEYERYRPAAEFDRGPYNSSYDVRPEEFQASILRSKNSSLALLNQAIRSLSERLEDAIGDAKANGGEPASKKYSPKRIFVVHGHDEATKQTVARFLEKIGFEAVILHEQPNRGRTIIAKFQEEAENTGFAVVIMTADDWGGKDLDNLRRRARQNVVFELGFFVGKLGLDRVVALVKGDIERPSDFDGVVYTSLDDGNWQTSLAKELNAAHYAIDWNKVMR